MAEEGEAQRSLAPQLKSVRVALVLLLSPLLPPVLHLVLLPLWLWQRVQVGLA